MCGKTSTAMLPGETIIGDDVAFLKKVGGRVRAVNMEMGMFGIIQGINSRDDPIQFHALRSDETHVIFSNVLVLPDGDIYWNDMDGDCPEAGINHSGDWRKGKADVGNKHVPASHKNARFAINLECLANVDERLHDPLGVEIDGMIYGGRDFDTWVPVEEAFGWEHGIITKGAFLESETTAATIGVRGIRVFNPMSNLDFLSIPVGTYIRKNLEFGKGMKRPPRIFGVNYFLRDMSGKYLSQKNDKHVWLKWMALRVEDAVDVIRTPTGLIPRYEDLRALFQEMAQKNYSEESYVKQFTFRVPPQEAKLHRMQRLYKRRVKGVPDELFEVLDQQMARIEEARLNFGNYISPFELIAQRKDYHWELSPHYRSHVAKPEGG
jgi:phosphoenolpyruvate carboxykinase (GTP)